LIAGFLYGEIAFVGLLLVPFIPSTTWHKVFKSRFLRGLESQLIYYFYVLVAILIMFFLEAMREMQKYSDTEHHQNAARVSHLDAQMQTRMHLFRSQRNFYISGFALFLCLVIKRMVSLMSANATLNAEKEAALKQAESASRAAETMMKSGGDGESEEVKDLKEKVKNLEKEVSSANKNVESMKAQSENLTQEYDRLMEEKDRLERKVNTMGDKKDE